MKRCVQAIPIPYPVSSQLVAPLASLTINAGPGAVFCPHQPAASNLPCSFFTLGLWSHHSFPCSWLFFGILLISDISLQRYLAAPTYLKLPTCLSPNTYLLQLKLSSYLFSHHLSSPPEYTPRVPWDKNQNYFLYPSLCSIKSSTTETKTKEPHFHPLETHGRSIYLSKQALKKGRIKQKQV